jgi:hypothetical protein
MKFDKAPSSYKDPSGFVFFQNNKILRQVNKSYKSDYDLLIKSGLYQKLVDDGLLVSHKEVKVKDRDSQAYKHLQPQLIPFISYPYEWCFSQLKDAALLTLQIQHIALEHNMSLKDATSFNIQFLEGKPIFIDTLSFEKYKPNSPWVAYRQFCEQFLAPLALYASKDVRLNTVLEAHAGSIPLDLAAKLLPASAKIKPSLLIHILFHAGSQKKYSEATFIKKPKKSFSKSAFTGLIDSLEGAIKGLKLKTDKTVWTNYYDPEDHGSYEDESLAKKKDLVSKFISIAKPKSLWDVGANTGVYSQIAADKNIFTVSFDNDHTVIEQNYLRMKKQKEKNILPLWVDVVNPTPAIGWENREREAFLSRPHPDVALALAIIHHLAISNNLPLGYLAGFFSKICKTLVIEFIPKEDYRVKLLLQSREDIFSSYDRKNFEKEFGKYFSVLKKSSLPNSKRTLYLLKRK